MEVEAVFQFGYHLISIGLLGILLFCFFLSVFFSLKEGLGTTKPRTQMYGSTGSELSNKRKLEVWKVLTVFNGISVADLLAVIVPEPEGYLCLGISRS